MNEILITTGAISGITAIFAFLLTLAKNTVGNYGEVQLVINEEKEFTVNGGEPLLSLLLEEKIFIPSACGGKGTCGYCKVKILEGGGPVLPTELPFLTEEEMENKVRLSCQCKVKEDIKIEIPEELFNVKEYFATVEEIEDLTDVIKRVKFRLAEGEEIKFKPGQFVQLKAPKYEGNNEEVYRAYSIASAPKEKDVVELLIGYVPDGICTTYVHKHLNVGDTVQINGPHGDFYYDKDSDNEMIMVAAGTGMAPILAILKYMEENDVKRKATFYFGARTPDDLFFLDYFKHLEDTLYDFEFIPTLSRVTEEHNWTGAKGRVNKIIEEQLESGENKEAYLCGNPKMIASMVAALTEKGVLEELIYFDEFE